LRDPFEFITDLSVKGMLHAVTIRSPIARGFLKEIKCPKLPETYRLITSKNIPGKNSLSDFHVPILADHKLSYIGQPVAILAGSEKSVLEDLLSGIEIQTEEEEPSFSCKTFSPEEEIVKRNIISGDPDKALGEGGIILSGKYITEIQEHWYSEPHGAVAAPVALSKGKGKKEMTAMTIYTATQWPYHVKSSVSEVLGWDPQRVTVVPTLMTPHLDGKIWYPSLVACHAALAAWVTGNPVKILLKREEDFLFSPKRNRAEIEMCSALEEKGSIMGSVVQLQLELGAHPVFENEIMDLTCLGSLGNCNHGAFKIDGSGILTNIPPQGPFAGFGLAQGFFAAERHFSHIADTIGQDPAEWRKNNCVNKNQNLVLGLTMKDTPPLAKIIDAAAFMSDYYRKWASYELLRKRRRGEKWESDTIPLRGIGISTAYQGSGFLNASEPGIGNYSVEVTLEKDGFLEIKTSMISSGAKFLETWQSLAQDILGVDPLMIRLTGNTAIAPDSGPGTLSRNISSITRLVEKCFVAIRNQRFRDPLPITIKRSGKPGKMRSTQSASEKEAEHDGGSGYTAGSFQSRRYVPESFAFPSWAAAVVEIEIDPVSLHPLTRGIWLAVDGGNILNEHRAKLTLKTGAIQALGWASREQLRYEEGKIPVECFGDYNIPAPEEIPPITVDFLPSDSTIHKGTGDLPFCCVPAAYVQAVSQAMDQHYEKIPLGVKDIWDNWKKKQTELPK
jgi:CO/xanthine dehydrogenase Mo-binding subunit